jgi:hypothetical protein
MANCPKCRVEVELPGDPAVRVVCPGCGTRLRVSLDAGEPTFLELPPRAEPVALVGEPPHDWPTTVPTKLLALVHFAFAGILTLFGLFFLIVMIGFRPEPQPEPPPEEPTEGEVALTERVVAYQIVSAVAAIVLAVVMAGTGSAVWWRERTGFFLSVALVAAVGAGLYVSFTSLHPAVLTLRLVAFLLTPYAFLIFVLMLLPDTFRDFWLHPRIDSVG